MSEFHHTSVTRKALMQYTCWFCGEPIQAQTYYSRHTGTLDGKEWTFRTHGMQDLKDCNLAHELLDQNPDTRNRVFWHTFDKQKETDE